MNDADNLDLSELGGYVQNHQWTLAGAVVLVVALRWFASSDVKGPINIPNEWKPWVLFAVGAPAMSAIDKLASGRPWSEAVANGLVVAVFALTGHNLVVKPTGKDVPAPAFLKKKDDGSGDPPDDPNAKTTKTRISFPPAGGAAAFIACVAALFLGLGCAPSTTPPGCAPDSALAEESARFQAKVLASCDRALPLSACPAYPAIKAEHDKNLENFIACRR